MRFGVEDFVFARSHFAQLDIQLLKPTAHRLATIIESVELKDHGFTKFSCSIIKRLGLLFNFRTQKFELLIQPPTVRAE